MQRRRAFTLILVLGFAATLLVLIFILGMQGQSLSSLIRSQESRLDRRLASLDTAARVGILLSATSQQRPPSRVTGPAVLNGTFSNQPYGLSQISGQVDWNRESVHYPLPSQPCSFDNLFEDQVPSVGYQEELLKKASTGQTVAPGHSLLNQQFNRTSSQTVFDHNFPYAAYAPSGEVQLQQVVSFHNPTFDESEGKLAAPPDPLQYASGLPVLVRAKGAVQVDQFSCGRALSENGPIQVQGGALGFSGDLAEDQFCKNLSSQTSQAMDQLRDGALNKSKWIAGDFLSFEGVVALFKGKSGAAAKILSVQQACSFPFPPFPVIQEDAFITVLLIHHPWPADFTGTASDQQDIDEMKSLGDQVKALQSQADRIGEQVKKLLPQRDDLKQQLKQPGLTDDQKEALQKQLDELQSQIDADQGQISDLDEQISELKAKIKEKQKTIDKKSKEVWNGLPGTIPNNAWEDAGQPTGSSWAYVIVGEALVKSIFKALGGDIQSLLQTLVPPVRLVHLGSVDPEWQFHSDKTWPYPGKQGYVMKATVNVPAGKTMKLSGEYDVPGEHIEIQGDLWIQKGATCFVDGNLHVTKPDTWTDLAGVAKSPLMPGQEGTSDDDFKPTPVGSESPDGSTNPLYPWGRIILEEGATLVVSGDLTVTGGNRDTGSVVCCSGVGPGKLINTAILCQGNVKIAHGVYSGLTLQDLVKRLAEKEVPSLDGFSKYFMKPFMEEVAPNLSKVWGPWNYRDPCYFAPHATTFVFLNFLAEFGLAEIPFPIPLPVENLECKIFSWLSKGYGFELNFNLGENFTTQSTWWLLGRGTVPFFLKVPPHLIQEAFANINYKQIVSEAILKAAKDFMTKVIPELLKSIVEEVAVKAVALILKEVIPFKFADAPEDGESEKIEKDFEKKVLAEIREIIEESTKEEIIQAVSEVVVEIKDKIVEEAATSSDANYLCREVPGVYLYSGQSMTVGQPGNSQAALSALGFFYAEGDLKVNAQRIVGALVSHTGSIQSTGLLYYYPYFTRAALYNPKKPRDYGSGPTDDLANAFQFTPPKPEGNTCIDLFVPWARVTAAGETP